MDASDSHDWQRRNSGRWLRLHPLSGAALLFLDNLFFGVNALTAGLATPIGIVAAALATFLATGWIQRKLARESRRMSLLKAVAAGIIAGLPFSVAGSTIGALVLLSAGLSRRAPGGPSTGR